MDSQDTNKIVRQILNSAMSKKRQLHPVQVQFNKTIKTNKSKMHLQERKSINTPNVVNLPQISPLSLQVKAELPNISRNTESRNNESRNRQSKQMENRRSKFNFHKTIFSTLQEPVLKPKRIAKPKDNTSQNSKSSKSKRSKSFKKLQLGKNLLKDTFGITSKHCHTPNIQRENLNELNLPKQNSQGNPQFRQFSTSQLHNQLSAKEIMLNGQTIVKESFQTPKMFKYQSLCPTITYESSQSPNKRLTGVDSGLQMIRQNKLKAISQFISQGDIGKAIQMLNFLLQIDQNDVEAMYTLAQLSEQQNNQDLSNKYLRLIILNQANSLRVDQQVFKAKALHKLGKYTQAIEKIQSIQGHFQLNSSANEKIELLKLKGEIYFDYQALEDALQCFQDALQIMNFHVFQKNKANISAYIGTIYQHYQLNKKAKKFFDLQSKLSGNQGKDIDENVSKRIKTFKEKKTKELKQIKQSRHIKWPPILKRTYLIQNTQKQQELAQTQLLLDSYKVLVTNHKDEKEAPRFTQKKEKQIPFEDKLKILGIYDKVLGSIVMESNSQLSKIEENAKLHYKMGNYEKCCDQFENYIRVSSFLRESSMNSGAVQKSVMKSSKNEERHEQISQGLNYYLTKIKQLEMNQMTEDNLSSITKRRNYNIAQAIKLFNADSIQQSLQQSNKLKDLSVIGEESTITIIKHSIFRQQFEVSNDIFSLKQFREVFKIWNHKQFSLESLNDIAAITYDLVKNDKTDFSILPLHVIAYTMKMLKQNLTFAEINKNIEQKFIELCKIYPPSQKSITKSELKQFDINFSNRQRVDLFNKQPQPENFKTIYKRVQELSRMASSQKSKMDEICKQICEQNKGFNYKSNLKLPVNIDGQNSDKNQRIYSRIIQKILAQELKHKKQNFFQRMKYHPQMRVPDLFIQMSQQWQKTIDQILLEKLDKKQQTHCYVYDLMRAKAMFHSVGEINLATQAFISSDKNEKFKIIQIDNRLNNKTKDVVLKIQFKTIVGELQLALQFQSQRNQFNHSLYELSRSPFGTFFASFMWLTGFATNNQSSKLIFNQKLKWKMRRLEHLKKFIYQERLIIGFDEVEIEDIVREQFKCQFLYLEEFVVKGNAVEGFLVNGQGKYVTVNFNCLQETHEDDNTDQSRIMVKSIGDSVLSITFSQHQTPQPCPIFPLLLNPTKPTQKFRFFFSHQRQSFASPQQFKSMRVHLNGTNYFLSIEKTRELLIGRKFVLKQEDVVKVIHNEREIIGNKKGQQQHQMVQERKNNSNDNNNAFRISFTGQKSLRMGEKDEIPYQDQSYQQQIDEIITIQKSLHQLLKNNFSFQ